MDLVIDALLSTYIISPEYFLTSGGATPNVNVCPRLYVLLFITVVIPVKEVSIPKSTEPPKIIKLPQVGGLAVN